MSYAQRDAAGLINIKVLSLENTRTPTPCCYSAKPADREEQQGLWAPVWGKEHALWKGQSISYLP